MSVAIFPGRLLLVLIHSDTLVPQIGASLVNFEHELLVRLRDVVEGEDAPAELKQEVCAKGNNGPEWELFESRRGLAHGQSPTLVFSCSSLFFFFWFSFVYVYVGTGGGRVNIGQENNVVSWGRDGRRV